MPAKMQLAYRRVSATKEGGIVILKMCGMHEIKLDTLDLWVKLQGYYFHLDEAERKEVDASGSSWAERLNVTPKAYKEGIPVLKNLGFIQAMGPGKHRVLRAGEIIDLLGRAAASTEGMLEVAV